MKYCSFSFYSSLSFPLDNKTNYKYYIPIPRGGIKGSDALFINSMNLIKNEMQNEIKNKKH